MRYANIFLMALLLAFTGCDDDPADGDGDADADADGDSDGDGDGDADADADSSPDADEDIPVCEQLGLPVREFQEAMDDPSLNALAADFTVPTRNGDWTLSENWTGCDTYLFVLQTPQQTVGWPTPLWDRDFPALFDLLPRNVHLFFISHERSSADRNVALDDVADQVDNTIGSNPEELAWWSDRIHLVTDMPFNLDGWLREVLLDPAWGAGIDRFQRVRYIGSYADNTRHDSGRGWYAPNISMMANEPIYYNFEAERETRLDAQDATVIPMWTGEVLSDRDPREPEVRWMEVELPDAAEMATYDTMELDLYLGCEGEGEYGTCPAWDYLVYLYLCDEDDPDVCDTEFGRWITTYHREGRWVHDVTSLLPLIADGGTRRFRFQTAQPYEVVMDMRLYNQAREVRPEELHYLWSGGAFNEDYNTAHEPVVLTIPDDATRVELATVISGHGMAMPGNCAEFCNTTHHFYVNGEENMLDFPAVGNNRGCMEMVPIGTVPNQYGTWWFGRSGWCPGLEVPVVTTDVTSQLLSGENTFEYEAFYGGLPYTVGGANIRLQSWLVISR